MVDHVFWGSNLQTWIGYNGGQNKKLAPTNMPWRVVFTFAAWSIWKSRNHAVFRGKNMNPNLAAEILSHAMEFVHCAAPPRAILQKTFHQIKWVRPPEGWIKLNTDGAVSGSAGLAGCGGIVRDDGGRWVAGFTRRIGITNSFEAELWGLRDGLMLCSNLNISWLMVELDAKALVDVLENTEYVNNIISPILDDCRLLVTQFNRIQFNHCYREANQCADSLARMGGTNNLDLTYFDSPPVDVASAYENDSNGLYFNRLCPRPFVVP